MIQIYDLHCHSTASDGILSPTAVVQRAVEKGVKILALTDHDTVSGLAQAREQAELLGIQLINGVEISTIWENREIHIVGLGFDPFHPEMTALLQKQAENRLNRAMAISEKLAKLGIPNAFIETQKLASGEVTRAHYARYLVQIGKVSNENQAFKKYLAQGKSAYVKPQWNDIATAINVIQQAGGVSVLAHPLRYDLTAKWTKKLIADFTSWGGKAMEVAGCGQTPDQRLLLARWAKEFNLSASVGSDFHFPCGWIELGYHLDLPPQCDAIWQTYPHLFSASGF